jgi:hypothetical protein
VEQLPRRGRHRGGRPVADVHPGRAADLDPRARSVARGDDLDVDASARGDDGRPAGDPGRPVHLVPVDRQDPVRRAGPCPGRTVVGVHHAQPHALPRTRVDGLRAPAVDAGGPVIGVQQGHDIRAGGVAVPRPDDQRTEQAADDLLVGDLVGVVPVAAGLLLHEPVGELLAAARPPG